MYRGYLKINRQQCNLTTLVVRGADMVAVVSAPPTGAPAVHLSARPTTTTGCVSFAGTTRGGLCRLRLHSGVFSCHGVSASPTALQCRLRRRLYILLLYNAVYIFICFYILMYCLYIF